MKLWIFCVNLPSTSELARNSILLWSFFISSIVFNILARRSLIATAFVFHWIYDLHEFKRSLNVDQLIDTHLLLELVQLSLISQNILSIHRGLWFSSVAACYDCEFSNFVRQTSRRSTPQESTRVAVVRPIDHFARSILLRFSHRKKKKSLSSFAALIQLYQDKFAIIKDRQRLWSLCKCDWQDSWTFASALKKSTFCLGWFERRGTPMQFEVSTRTFWLKFMLIQLKCAIKCYETSTWAPVRRPNVESLRFRCEKSNFNFHALAQSVRTSGAYTLSGQAREAQVGEKISHKIFRFLFAFSRILSHLNLIPVDISPSVNCSGDSMESMCALIDDAKFWER